jgi:hypothetical protein
MVESWANEGNFNVMKTAKIMGRKKKIAEVNQLSREDDDKNGLIMDSNDQN